ncbi:MAG: hypothetical protein ACRYFU_09420 [Janthinobacterium lividum]
MTATGVALLSPTDFTGRFGRFTDLPDPEHPALFNRLIREASSKGMRYVEALIYVVEHRRMLIN